MTTYSNDPIRIKITLDDLMNLTHTKGIDSCAYAVPDSGDPSEYVIKLCCSDINPTNPFEEKYKEDLEKEINEKLNVIQDHIREFSIHRLFNSKKDMVKETVLDEKLFSKDNRYDVLLDKLDKNKQWHYLPNGKRFGIIESE